MKEEGEELKRTDPSLVPGPGADTDQDNTKAGVDLNSPQNSEGVNVQQNNIVSGNPESVKAEQDNIEAVREAPEKEPQLTNSEVVALLGDKLDGLQKQMFRLEEEFQGKLKYDQHKEQIIDRLHKELQKYKNQLLKDICRPFILAIIYLIDDINKSLAFHKSREKSQLDPVELLKLIESYPSDLEEILSRQGIESFVCDEPCFNPSLQKVLKTLETSEKSKGKSVVRSLRRGYRWSEDIIRPEMVEVYVYKGQDKEANEPEKKEVNNNE